MLNSIWAESCDLPKFESLKGEIKTDVLIVGGGLAGLLCAYRLHQAGIDYTLIEADAVANGVTRNTTAKITSQHGLIYGNLLKKFGAEKAYLYWEANETALENYRTLAKDTDCDFEVKDSYIYSTSSLKKIENELNALEKLHIPAEFTDNTELPLKVSGAVKFSEQAQFNPYKFIKAICENLNIYEHTAAKEFAGNTVLTDKGKITAQKIIIATHFPIINKHGSYFLKMYQHRSYVAAYNNAITLNGMYLDEDENGLSFRSYKDLLLIGSGGHRTGKKSDGWNGAEAYAGKNYPNSKIYGKWATQDCMTLDQIPYIGQYSQRTHNLYVATGFNKWGMTSSMAAANLLTNIIKGKDDPLTKVFSPSRTILRKQIFINAFETTSNLLNFTKPRCPHLGCALKWNEIEHTWDCPCHGSRFTKHGKLLNNPATDDIDIKS